MWNNLFHFDIAPLNLLVRAVLVYLSIVVLLRISGKRQLGQMGATDFVAILLVSNAVQNSMTGGDNSLVGGIFLAAILIALSASISYFTYRNTVFRKIAEGTSTLLIHRGKFIKEHLKREFLSEGDVKILLREQGIHSLSEVHTAILEADGKLSITKVSDLKVPPSTGERPSFGPKN